MLEIVTSLIPSRLIRTLRLKKLKKTFRGAGDIFYKCLGTAFNNL